MAAVAMFFGLGIAGFAVLFIAGKCARTKVSAWLGGLFGAALLAGEFALIGFASALGSAFSGESLGTGLVFMWGMISAVAIGVYIAAMVKKFSKGPGDNHEEEATPEDD